MRPQEESQGEVGRTMKFKCSKPQRHWKEGETFEKQVRNNPAAGFRGEWRNYRLAQVVERDGARGRSRTGTWLPTRDFKSRASTSSATPGRGGGLSFLKKSPPPPPPPPL